MKHIQSNMKYKYTEKKYIICSWTYLNYMTPNKGAACLNFQGFVT